MKHSPPFKASPNGQVCATVSLLVNFWKNATWLDLYINVLEAYKAENKSSQKRKFYLFLEAQYFKIMPLPRECPFFMVLAVYFRLSGRTLVQIPL